MNRLRLLASFLAIFLIICATPSSNAYQLDEDNFYVVIGAFSLKKNADNFLKYSKTKGFDAQIAWRDSRNLYYVWYYVSGIKPKAVEEVKKAWSVVDDAWVYTGTLMDLSGNPIVANDHHLRDSYIANNPGLDYGRPGDNTDNQGNNTSTSSEGTQSGNDQSGNAGNNQTGNTQTNQTDGNTTQSANNENNQGNTESGEGEEGKEVFVETDSMGIEDARPTGLTVDQLEEEPDIQEDYKLYVNTVNSVNFQEVIGRLDVLDIVRSRKLTEITSHTLTGVNNPKNGTGEVEVATRFFGFRQMSVRFSITDPESDTTGLVSVHGDSIIVDMPLEPLQHGDLAVLWNVLYFKDAAIMRPESRAELNEVLKFMNENPNYNVVLHGHTNGSSTGKIIHLNKEDTEYFSMSGDHKESRGSAKKLSEERAFTIQQWLTEQGIQAGRTSIEGWGGKRMLYEEDDPRAFLNVRVEVEVIDPDQQ